MALDQVHSPPIPYVHICWAPGPLVLCNSTARLLSNAVKYSPHGGTILVSIGRKTEGSGRQAILVVRDTGLGIPSAALPRLFDPFHRAANVVGRIPGTGLGLATARHIVEQHGGTIEVASEEGVGTTFTVTLPLGSDDAVE